MTRKTEDVVREESAVMEDAVNVEANYAVNKISSFQGIDNFLARLDKVFYKLRWLAIFASGVLPLLVFTDVVFRMISYTTANFGFDFPLLLKLNVPGSYELQGCLMALTTFAFLPLLEVRSQHMGIDVIYNSMSKALQRWSDVVVGTLTITILGMLTVGSIDDFIIKQTFRSAELAAPMWLYAWMPCMGLFLAMMAALPMGIRGILRCCKERHYISLLLGLAFSACVIAAPFVYRMAYEAGSIDLSALALGALVFALMLFLLFIKMPISWAMCVAGAIGMICVYRTMPAAFSAVATTPWSEASRSAFVALPMFVLMGSLILYSGLSDDLFDSANKWIGHIKGGVGMASIAGCTGFSAVCGDSLATAMTMGKVALPEMARLKYKPSLATGAIAAGGTLGILIPPSSGFIIYGLITEVSIGRLFMAGIVPGLLLSFLFMLYINIRARINPAVAPAGERHSWKERFLSVRGILPILVLFMLVLGGIVSGFCGPNEGGAVGVVGAFAFAMARRRLNRDNIIKSVEIAAVLTARLMCILIGVAILGYFLTEVELPKILATWIATLEFNRYVIFSIIIIVYITLGCVMNVIPMLMLTIPSLFPTILEMGFDPVWFGVISVMVMEMGQITPPVGVVVFALSGVADGVPIQEIFKGIIPFVGLIILAVIIVTIFPALATWLPYSMMGPELM